MARSVSKRNRNRWALLPGQNAFLAVLLLLLVCSYGIRNRSGLLFWQDGRDIPSSPPDPFVVEIAGDLGLSGIYTFPEVVEINEVLLAAGVDRDRVPKEASPPYIKTGTKIVLDRSREELRIHMETMDPTKRILYGVPVDVNEIHADELTLIPGIGPTLAGRIVQVRNEKGRFTRVDELLEVSGIGKKKLEVLQRYLAVEAD